MKTRWGRLLLGPYFRMLATFAIVLAGRVSLLQAIEIPPQPAIDGHGQFVHDLALELRGAQSASRQIAADQRTAFEQHDVPIIVVTIYQMSEYGYSGSNIQPFAKDWFNTWEIGTMDRPGGHNRGILVLVSVKDRKGRIELGGDWGHRFDLSCQDVMDNLMIPHFKNGDYAAGLAAGVKALGEMAAVGPKGQPPRFRSRKSIVRGVRNFFEQLVQGALSLLMAVAVVILVWLMPAGSGSGRGFGGGGYSGGGFSGGSSGGGGASGSW